jgi:hypothetical protein
LYVENLINFFFSNFLTYSQDGDIHVFETKSDQAKHIQCADQYYFIVIQVSYFKSLKIIVFFILIILEISLIDWNKSK